jgi:hypothetical protein
MPSYMAGTLWALTSSRVPAQSRNISLAWSTFRGHEPTLVDPITPEPRWMSVHTHRLGQVEAEHRTKKYAGFIGDLLVVYPRFRQRWSCSHAVGK